jgi:histone H2B
LKELRTIRKPRRRERYHNHLYKVLRQVQGWDISISAKAMNVMNEFSNHSFDRIMDEASRLVRYSGKATLTEREVQMAVRLVLPGELARHADKFGTKRIDRSYKADYEDYECGSSNLEPLVEYEYEHY